MVYEVLSTQLLAGYPFWYCCLLLGSLQSQALSLCHFIYLNLARVLNCRSFQIVSNAVRILNWSFQLKLANLRKKTKTLSISLQQSRVEKAFSLETRISSSPSIFKCNLLKFLHPYRSYLFISGIVQRQFFTLV